MYIKGITESKEYPIEIKAPDGTFVFTKYGSMSEIKSAKCVIFPKDRTTWEGFQRPFKDGEIVATMSGNWIGITTGGESKRLIPTYCALLGNSKFEAYLGRKEKWLFDRFATEKEKEKLFKAIKENGYTWNAETKTLEKLVEPKQPKCPKTYGECCDILDVEPYSRSAGYKSDLITAFRRLLISRDAYWKIAGEQMGLGIPWKPNFLNPTKEIRYFIFCTGITIEKGQGLFPSNKFLIFPTEEMCDAFYENFKELIELCKELL